MSILIDRPRWPWRGEYWSHLVSDTDLDELHRFAATIGVRRLAFQGDHYDVPDSRLDRALGLGAKLVDSRELVSRLRASGLRHRQPMGWHRHLVWSDEDPASWATALADSGPVPTTIEADLRALTQQHELRGAVILRRPREWAVGVTTDERPDPASLGGSERAVWSTTDGKGHHTDWFVTDGGDRGAAGSLGSAE